MPQFARPDSDVSLGGWSSPSWSTEVVVYPVGRDTATGTDAAVIPASRVVITPPAPIPAALPPRDKPRAELVRDLQRELKRVGCYYGEVDGEWGVGSKRSMRAFVEQVNSRLQSDDPDLIQLTLVRGYTGAACKSAPGLITASRTPPAPAPVQYAAPATSPVVTGSTDQPVMASDRAPPLDGRMSVGAPLPAEAAPSSSSLVSAPTSTPTVRGARPRPQQPQQQQQAAQAKPRRDRAWTANFFNP